MILHVIAKNVYGRVLFYPADEAAEKIAHAMGIKAFSESQIKDLKKAGLKFIQVPNPDLVSHISNSSH